MSTEKPIVPERPKMQNRRVFATDQLTAEEIAAFEGARMDPRHNHLDDELKDWDDRA